MFSSAALSRRTLRLGHLIQGGLLAAHVYTPLGESSPMRLFVRVVLMPAIVLTGLLMWKLPALRARARTRRRAPSTAHA